MSYTYLAKPLLFSMDAEVAHNVTLNSLSRALKVPGIKSLLRASFVRDTPALSKELWGLEFKNPVGLAAGLDKDGIVGTGWAHLGFGFVELGTITPRPQPGNPKKRLFRLPQDKAGLLSFVALCIERNPEDQQVAEEDRLVNQHI